MAQNDNKNNFHQPDNNKQQNLDKYDNPIQNDEAQNVTESNDRLSGAAAKHAGNKADEGMKQGRGSQKS